MGGVGRVQCEAQKGSTGSQCSNHYLIAGLTMLQHLTAAGDPLRSVRT